MNRCKIISGAALCAAAGLWIGGAFAGPNGMADSGCGLAYTRTALWPEFDGKYCKMTPSVVSDGKGLAFMTYGMLLLKGSDVFCGSYISKSTDDGETWSQPCAVAAFPDTREHGLRVTRSCNPCYNRKHGLWFGLGLALCYENDRVPFTTVVDGRPYGWPLFAKFDPKTGKFSEVVKIDFPLPYARAYPFGQMVELDDGDMLVPFNWEPLEKAQNKNDGYSVFGRIVIARCRVDQNGFKIVEVGKPIACDGLRRGVGEPSLIRLGKKFYLTLRSDEYGMWCASEDGLNFSAPKRWTWVEDGKEIGNRNTQQHWMKVGGKLYLAYTRVTPTNGHVFRNRAPVFLAEFDSARGGLVRETEMPLVPERGARLGNFCCTEDGRGGSWLVTAEWMQPIGCEKYGSDNSIWLVKVSERPAAMRNRGVLLLTFDDAFFHNWDKALPLFDRYGAHATFFVDGRGDERTNLMKMRTYQSYGHSVGFHSAGHVPAKPIIAQKGIDAWLKTQIEPQVAAAKKANLTVRNFAYPNSSRTDETDAALRPHFDRLRTGHLFNRDPAKRPLATCDEAFISRDKLVSSHLLWGMGFSSKFPGIAEDLEKGLERLAARNEALVLYSHDIKEKPDGDCHNTSLDVLERILAKAHVLGIEVIGFDEIGSPCHVNDRLAREFISHDGLLLDYVGEIPTAEEIADLKPNAMGWWSPIENGSMFTGEWLPALMAEGASRKALVERCVRGLIKMSEVSDVPGFIARGTGTDGKSHHPLGSNDQTDPWFFGLCEYCRWPHADPALKAKALERLVFVARALERNGWGVPCDGAFKGENRGNLNAKAMPFWGQSRLLYSLKSLHRLTGDAHWSAVYESIKGEALDAIEAGGEIDRKVFPGCYGGGVWIYLSSVEALARLIEMEENPNDRARMRKGLLRYAERVAPLMKNRAKYANTTERPFKYANWRTGYAWRVQKTQKDAEAVAHSGKREVLGSRKDYERSGMSIPLCAAAICALSGEAKYRGEILATLRHYDYSTPNISEFFHAAVAAAAIGAFGDTEKDVLVRDGVKAGDFGTPQVIVTEVAPERAHLAWPKKVSM